MRGMRRAVACVVAARTCAGRRQSRADWPALPGRSRSSRAMPRSLRSWPPRSWPRSPRRAHARLHCNYPEYGFAGTRAIRRPCTCRPCGEPSGPARAPAQLRPGAQSAAARARASGGPPAGGAQSRSTPRKARGSSPPAGSHSAVQPWPAPRLAATLRPHANPLRPSAPAQRVFADRFDDPHRRTGGGLRRARHAGAGADRPTATCSRW